MIRIRVRKLDEKTAERRLSLSLSVLVFRESSRFKQLRGRVLGEGGCWPRLKSPFATRFHWQISSNLPFDPLRHRLSSPEISEIYFDEFSICPGKRENGACQMDAVIGGGGKEGSLRELRVWWIVWKSKVG